MGRRRKPGRNVSGILLLDKPPGLTSNEALQQVKYLYRAAKAGHTGSLDPLATGLLPICFGEATKISPYLLDADKRYRVLVRLGIATSTADAEGEVLETRPTDHLRREDVIGVLDRFRGPIEQMPPMYSAIKHKGERLYNLARRGVEVERQTRSVIIHEISLTAFDLPDFKLDVHCSKGTYVRTLAEDIGKALGCGGHVAGLRRTAVGPFADEDSVTLEVLEKEAAGQAFDRLDSRLLPVERALTHWPKVRLSEDGTYYLKRGQAVLVPHAPTSGWVRIYSDAEEFIGVGRIQEDGKVAPKRMLYSS